MKLKRDALLFATLMTLLGSSAIYADEKPAPDETSATEKKRATDKKRAAKEKPSEATPATHIDDWVAQLGSERLTERSKAEKRLVAAGKQAIPALAKAALAGNRATIEKSIDVLGKLAQSKDEETKEAARITLQMLSESDQPSTAERAKVALSTKEADGIKPFEGWDKPGNPFAGGGNMNRSVSMSNINGLRTISVKEGPLETTLQELRGGRILAQITGGEEPVELIAKNAEDLKQKLPDAAALYEQYTSGNQAGNQGPAMLFPGFNFGNMTGGQQTFNSSVTIQGGGIGGNLDSQEMLRRQLTELKVRMKGNPAMQQMLDQQIRALSGE